MSNTTDLVLSSAQTMTITPQMISYIVETTDKDGNKGHSIVFHDGTSIAIDAQQYESVKALDYSGGGGGSTGGSDMVYNTETGALTGAKDQDGNDVTLYTNTITISF